MSSICRKEAVRGDTSLTAACPCRFGKWFTFKIYLKQLESHNNRAISCYGAVYFCAPPLFLFYSLLLSHCVFSYLDLTAVITVLSSDFLRIDLCDRFNVPFDQMKYILFSTAAPRQKASVTESLTVWLTAELQQGQACTVVLGLRVFVSVSVFLTLPTYASVFF